MGTWTKQKGYPVLTLAREKDGTVYKVVQVTNILFIPIRI
jgi:aminopeptidase N